MTIIDKSTTYISPDAVIAEDAIIYPNNHILGSSVIGSGCKIMPNCIIEDSAIGANTVVTASVMQEARVGENTTVGPYAYLRKGAKVGNHCRIGDFVEIKNATVGDYTKASHLAYMGDVTIGERCNVGCGVIFVNYDGKTKHSSVVEDNCFIGSNCNIIAPVTLREGSYIAAGTTVTHETPMSSFVIGRSRQIIKESRGAERYGD
jgi:bifunctional UDP-N-acetylglucosamine pyrophosphorylase/glucosamine-1-phosphate N-acetyltransferase